MIEGYKSIKEISVEWNLTPRSIQIMCSEGKIPGAGKIGRTWAVPSNAVKPMDARVTTGKYKNWRKPK